MGRNCDRIELSMAISKRASEKSRKYRRDIILGVNQRRKDGVAEI